MKQFTLMVVVMIALLLSSFKIVMAFEYIPGVFLSLSEAYNDNVFLTNTDRKGDFITYVSPGVSFALRSPLSQLKFIYNPSFIFYGTHSSQDTTSQVFNADGSFNASDKLKFTVDETFVKSSQVVDLVSAPNLGPIKSTQEVTFNGSSGSVSYKFRDNLTATLGASYLYSEVKGAGFTNTNGYGGSGTLAYMMTDRTTFSAGATYQRNIFGHNNSDNEFYTLGVTHKFTPTLSLAIAGGASTSMGSAIGKEVVGFNGSAALSKKFEKGDAVLSVAESVVPAAEYGQPLRYETVSLTLSRPIASRWTAFVNGSYAFFESIANVSLPGISSAKGEEERAGAGISYAIRPWANIKLSYNFINHTDKINSTNDYYNNIAMLTFTLSLERRPAETPPK